MTDDEPVVGARYQLGEVLGRGGMAEVRRGVDLRLGRAVAVKRLSPQLAADPTFQERFRREAQAAASLNHSSIAAVYDSGEESDPSTGISIPYIVMELVAGSTLRDVLRSEGNLPPERAIELTQGVLGALDHSHGAGIIHRDIKPANVMLTPDGGIKVMDFGIARAATDTSGSLTQTAAVIGTAQYLSPEQARGESVDQRSDIYSTGCLLYELLVGRPPFVGESSVSVAYQHVREPAVPPSQLNPGLSPDIDAITLKALAKDPAERYQTAREMQADITRVLGGDPVSTSLPLDAATTSAAAAAARALPTTVLPTLLPAPLAADLTPTPVQVPVAVLEEPRRQQRRSAGRTVLIAALAVVLLAGIGYGLFRWATPNDAAASVSIPDVRGATRADADRELRAAGIAPRFVDVEGPRDGTLNTVIKLDPEGGTQVPTGSTVMLEVNVGPKNAEIPDGLVGDDVADAKDKLERAGFSRVRTEKAADPPAKASQGEVVKIDPKEGTPVALGQLITLSYVADAPRKTSAPATSAPATSAPTTSGPATSAPASTAGQEPRATGQPTTDSRKPTDPTTTDRPPPTDPPRNTEKPPVPDGSTKPTPSSSPTSSEPSAPSSPTSSAGATTTPGAVDENPIEKTPQP